MVLGTIWMATKSKPNDEEANILTSWEPIRTMTTERLNKIRNETNLKFANEMLYCNGEDYDKCMRSDWINVDVQVVTDENFDQFCFSFSKEDFTHWCNGALVRIASKADHNIEDIVKEYLHGKERPVRLFVRLDNCSCAPNWLFTEENWNEYLIKWKHSGYRLIDVYRDYRSDKFFEEEPGDNH